jgi:exonuclease SbcC
MIREISLSNFQSHKDSHLEFSDGVNVILGASDSGKTAIIRALRWVATNKPSGDAFRSYWGGKTSVELFTDDAHIVRSRDKDNEYVLGDTHFKAFSTETPKEIVDALRLDSVNMQAQLDSPFLLSETPGDVAAHWNKIAKLEAIDKGTTNINSAIRELTSDIKYKSEQETKLISDIATYPDMEIYEYDVEVLEQMEKEKAVLANSANKLHAVCSAYRLTNANLKEKSEILKLEHPLNNILDLIDQKKHTEANFQKLNGILLLIHHNECKIADIDKTLTLEQPVSELIEMYKERDLAENRVVLLSATLSNVKGIQDRIEKGRAYIASQEALFTKEMGSQCILCGSKLKHEHNEA